MKYFPKPDELGVNQIKQLYQLKRFDEWEIFISVLDDCRERIVEQQVNESLKGDPYIIFRHIGALALIEELRQFMDEVEEYLETLTKRT